MQPEKCNGVVVWLITKLVLANQKPRCANCFVLRKNPLVKEAWFVFMACFLFVCFQEHLFVCFEGKQRLREMLCGGWVDYLLCFFFFFVKVMREFALSCGACWSEIEEALTSRCSNL